MVDGEDSRCYEDGEAEEADYEDEDGEDEQVQVVPAALRRSKIKDHFSEIKDQIPEIRDQFLKVRTIYSGHQKLEINDQRSKIKDNLLELALLPVDDDRRDLLVHEDEDAGEEGREDGSGGSPPRILVLVPEGRNDPRALVRSGLQRRDFYDRRIWVFPGYYSC